MSGEQQPTQPPGMQRALLAILAAWVFPGAGHLLLGKSGRALLFGALIWLSFGLGLAHDGRLALRDANQPFLTGLQVVANSGVGPADLVARMSVYGQPIYNMPADGARDRTVVEKFRSRARSGASIYGTAYLWTAGLMNLLLLFDVWDIGRGQKD